MRYLINTRHHKVYTIHMNTWKCFKTTETSETRERAPSVLGPVEIEVFWYRTARKSIKNREYFRYVFAANILDPCTNYISRRSWHFNSQDLIGNNQISLLVLPTLRMLKNSPRLFHYRPREWHQRRMWNIHLLKDEEMKLLTKILLLSTCLCKKRKLNQGSLREINTINAVYLARRADFVSSRKNCQFSGN